MRMWAERRTRAKKTQWIHVDGEGRCGNTGSQKRREEVSRDQSEGDCEETDTDKKRDGPSVWLLARMETRPQWNARDGWTRRFVEVLLDGYVHARKVPEFTRGVFLSIGRCCSEYFMFFSCDFWAFMAGSVRRRQCWE